MFTLDLCKHLDTICWNHCDLIEIFISIYRGGGDIAVQWTRVSVSAVGHPSQGGNFRCYDCAHCPQASVVIIVNIQLVRCFEDQSR